MQEPQEQALNYVKGNGPVLPVQLAKGLKIDLTLAGALLSELYAHKQIAMSTAKIGTSKLYYVLGQEEKLQILYDHLGATPKKAYDLLKENLVVKDTECTPWQRVAYREMIDFAKSFTYENELYWRWYLISENLAREKIKPVIPEVKEEKKEINEEKSLGETEKIEIKKPNKPKIKKEKIKEQTQTTLVTTTIELPEELTTYLKEHGIVTQKAAFNYKNKEIHMSANVPAAFGTAPYYVIYLDKKKINDADLGMIYAKGQQYKSPILLLSAGELSKKAEKYLEKEYHGSIIYRQL